MSAANRMNSRYPMTEERDAAVARARLGPHQLVAQTDQVADEFAVHLIKCKPPGRIPVDGLPGIGA